MRLTEKEIVDILLSQMDWYVPLELCNINLQSNFDIDAIVDFSIQDGPSFTAAVEFLTISTPKAIRHKSNVFINSSFDFRQQGLVPMIVAPYISKKQAVQLKERKISWIDLSGNMLLNIPPGIYIERMGQRNKYPDTAPIKKVYQGISSLVSRALLVNPEGFSSLNEIVDFINQRSGEITLATVSKVLKSLEEELLISRKKSRIYVKQPSLLLENLAEGYAEYSKRRKDHCYKYDVDSLDELCKAFKEANSRYAFGGFYAAKLKGYGTTGQVTIFIKSIQELKKAIDLASTTIIPDNEYGQVKFIETKNPCVWFNYQNEPSGNIVDDLELYLEMTIDRPRGPKVANQLEKQILRDFNG